MMKQETKTGKEALLQAAGIIRRLSKMDYYNHAPGQMLNNVKRADRVMGLLEKGGIVPLSFFRKQPINRAPYGNSLKKAESLFKSGEPFLAIPYTLSAAEKAVVKAAGNKDDFAGSIYPLKRVFVNAKATLGSAADKLEKLAAEPSDHHYGYYIKLPTGFLGC